MKKMDPKALRELRSRNNLTRQALATVAGVSERTLSRIENAESARPAREDTLRGLAEKFGVTIDVMTGDAPVPDLLPVVDAVPRLVMPGRLRSLREKRGWSRAKLAEKSEVSERQIARLETSQTKARPTTLERLGRALGVDGRTLAYDADANAGEPHDVTLGGRVAPQLRLAFDLVGRRYGLSRREIIELAPLLFALAAEGCLAWRRGRIEEAGKALARLEEFGNENQLYFARYLAKMDEGYSAEEESIAKNDLRGEAVRTEQMFSVFNPDDLYAVTPFADYLRKQAMDLDIGGVVDFFPETDMDATVGLDTIWGAEPYVVCWDDLSELTAESRPALWALASGDVPLRRIPENLLAPDAQEARVEWLERNLSDAERQRLGHAERQRRESADSLLRSFFEPPDESDKARAEDSSDG